MKSDIKIFGQDTDLSLGDFIEKYLTDDEQIIAEAIGKLFYDRSLEEYDKRKEYDQGKIDYKDWNPWDKYDGSRYGIDFYKLLGYQMVLKCKETSNGMKAISENGVHDWKQFLVIMFGKEVRGILANPRAHIFA
jgi:hypothetical protein